MVIAEPVLYEMFTIFGFGADLRREMSTKSNGNPAAWGSAAVVGGGTLVSDIGILQRARMELAYFSGYFRLKQRQTGGAGVIPNPGSRDSGQRIPESASV
jgi:hypothetical protein